MGVVQSKAKFTVSCSNKEQLERFLSEKGLELSEQGEYIIIENRPQHSNQFVVLHESGYELVEYWDIIYFEAYLSNVYCISGEQRYMVQSKLYELEEKLDPGIFMRVNKSFIVNLKKIHRIIPEMNSKFTLIMDNQEEILVTRTYLKDFKDYFGI